MGYGFEIVDGPSSVYEMVISMCDGKSLITQRALAFTIDADTAPKKRSVERKVTGRSGILIKITGVWQAAPDNRSEWKFSGSCEGHDVTGYYDVSEKSGWVEYPTND